MTKTTINLLFLLLIISIITGYIVSVSTNALEKARFAVSDYNLASINTAIELYYADNNFYPKAAGSELLIEELKSGGYIRGVITNPSLFAYTLSDNGDFYSLSIK